jgi:hypothetical protein
LFHIEALAGNGCGFGESPVNFVLGVLPVFFFGEPYVWKWNLW